MQNKQKKTLTCLNAVATYVGVSNNPDQDIMLREARAAAFDLGLIVMISANAYNAHAWLIDEQGNTVVDTDKNYDHSNNRFTYS